MVDKLTKAEKFVLVNQAIKKSAIMRMNELPLDGSVTLVLTKTGSKSARQRGLQHIWYNDVCTSGLGGHYESNEDVLDVYAKYRWGIRILLSDEIGPNENGLLAEAFLEYKNAHASKPEKMMWWVAQNIHTEDMSQNQMAQFLTAFRDYYGYEIGVELTDPDQKGWANLLEISA